MRSFLAYWKPSTADHELELGNKLVHAASDQFGRVLPGDEVWLVTVRNGQPFLLGKICVRDVVDRDTASRMLNTDDLWEANHHLVAVDGTAQSIVEIDLSDVVDKLRFVSTSGRDRLTVDNGLVDAKQLQTMRELTAESAAELESAAGSAA